MGGNNCYFLACSERSVRSTNKTRSFEYGWEGDHMRSQKIRPKLSEKCTEWSETWNLSIWSQGAQLDFGVFWWRHLGKSLFSKWSAGLSADAAGTPHSPQNFVREVIKRSCRICLCKSAIGGEVYLVNGAQDKVPAHPALPTAPKTLSGK